MLFSSFLGGGGIKKYVIFKINGGVVKINTEKVTYSFYLWSLTIILMIRLLSHDSHLMIYILIEAGSILIKVVFISIYIL